MFKLGKEATHCARYLIQLTHGLVDSSFQMVVQFPRPMRHNTGTLKDTGHFNTAQQPALFIINIKYCALKKQCLIIYLFCSRYRYNIKYTALIIMVHSHHFFWALIPRQRMLRVCDNRAENMVPGLEKQERGGACLYMTYFLFRLVARSKASRSWVSVFSVSGSTWDKKPDVSGGTGTHSGRRQQPPIYINK